LVPAHAGQYRIVGLAQIAGVLLVENKVISQGNSRKGVAFLPKPFSADALGAAVRRVLDG
jgi:hypothetical protein